MNPPAKSGILSSKRSSLQGRGNLVGASGGELFARGEAPTAARRCRRCRDRAPPQNSRWGCLKKRRRASQPAARQLPLLAFPNLRRPTARRTIGSRQHRGAFAGGTPARGRGLQEHWQIAERLALNRSERSVRIAQRPLWVTLLGQVSSPGARPPDAADAATVTPARGYREVMPPIW